MKFSIIGPCLNYSETSLQGISRDWLYFFHRLKFHYSQYRNKWENFPHRQISHPAGSLGAKFHCTVKICSEEFSRKGNLLLNQMILSPTNSGKSVVSNSDASSIVSSIYISLLSIKDQYKALVFSIMHYLN